MRSINILNEEYFDLLNKLNTVEFEVRNAAATAESCVNTKNLTLAESLEVKHSKLYEHINSREVYQTYLSELANRVKKQEFLSLEESYKVSYVLNRFQTINESHEFAPYVYLFSVAESNIPATMDKVTYTKAGINVALKNIAFLQEKLEKATIEDLAVFSILH